MGSDLSAREEWDRIVARRLEESPRILEYVEDAFLLVSKPWDVRMDGDGHPVTLETLLDSWLTGSTGLAHDEEPGARKKKGDRRYRWVHRLDYATSGVVCVALSKQAARVATSAFEERVTEKQYLAVLSGYVNFEQLLQEHPAQSEEDQVLFQLSSTARQQRVQHAGTTFKAKNPSDSRRPAEAGEFQVMAHEDEQGRKMLRVCCLLSPIPDSFQMMVGGAKGRYSETIIEIMHYGRYRGAEVTKVRLFPITGRRHQLRVHSHLIGHPIVGDVTYSGDATAARMMLHAHSLRIPLHGRKVYEKFGLPSWPPYLAATDKDPFTFLKGELRVSPY